MYYLRNNLILILIIMMSLVLVGCGTKEYTLNVIKEEEIMLQEEKEYYVYFYKEECPYCDDVFALINEYLENPTELKLYVCRLEDGSKINRKVEDGSGQGPDGKYRVDYVIEYSNLFIAGVPSLIRVKDNSIYYECFFVTSGRKNIIEYFTQLNDLK